MFAQILGAPAGTIARVKPDGTWTTFATNAPGDLTGCGGGLWIANQNGCFVVKLKNVR